MRLKDKVAIITGGSRGIGYATADAFLREGAKVILTASSQESADKAVARLKEKHPGSTVAGISPNLADLKSVRDAFVIATAQYGCVDILVNNAGVSESTPFMEYTEETFDKVMDLNVKGVFNATRVAADCMTARGSGVILSTSSMVSISGQRICLPRIQVRRQRTDGIPGKGAGPQGHPCQRGSPRHYRNGYDESRSQRSDRAHDRQDPPAAAGTAGRHCQCIRIPGQR